MKKNISDILIAWKADSNSISNDDKKLLIKYAKDAYYNTGIELMSDIEYDKLEKEVGLENKTDIGAESDTTYVIPHPYIMGSLSKVQVKEDKDGTIDWNKYLIDIRHFIKCAGPLVITPKYDGCSYEITIESKFGYPFEITSISTRGNGKYGKDIKPIIENVLDKDFIKNVINYFKSCYAHAEYEEVNKIVLRGEVLVNKDVFKKKYGNEFANTRAFVSGILNRQYTPDSKEYMDMVKDLSIVCYEVKYHLAISDKWHEVEWEHLKDCDVNHNVLPQFYKFATFIRNYKDFECLYHEFENYRNNKCSYSLDGIVIKPINRENNLTKPRPTDCVAIKFVPELQETTVTNIEWNIGKTGEYIPIIIFNPVIIDGKTITKCSGHNYGILVKNKVGIGSKIVVRLAGDIIPDLYKVTDSSKFTLDTLNLPDVYSISGPHLMSSMNTLDSSRRMFVASAISANIPTIGDIVAGKIWDYYCVNNSADEVDNDFFGEESQSKPNYTNIFQLSAGAILDALKGKLGENAAKAFEKVRKNISLTDIIVSCNFEKCGQKIAEQCSNYILGGPYDFTHLAEVGYSWCKNPESEKYQYLSDLVVNIKKKSFADYIASCSNTEKNVVDDRIPVILTGEPTQYSTKSEFLKLHPEYRNTTKWSEVKIVFTNSLDSTTGKMKKAKEKNIEIRLY